MCQPSDGDPSDSERTETNGGDDKGEITKWLDSFRSGESVNKDALIALIERRLRQIAGDALSRERNAHTLEISDLVQELWIKLFEVDKSIEKLHTSKELYLLAAEAIQNILVSYARARGAEKRGGGKVQNNFDDLHKVVDSRTSRTQLIDFLLLKEAMASLQQQRPELLEVAKLKIYTNSTLEQISETLGVSTATVERRWSFARSFLADHMKEDPAVFD